MTRTRRRLLGCALTIGLTLVLLGAIPSVQGRSDEATIDGFARQVFLPLVLRSPSLPPEPTPLPPTPTPEPPAPGVYILDNSSSYVDSINYLHIVGEVQNDTGHNLRFVKVTVNVFDNEGHLVATDFTYTTLRHLPAGEKVCFQVFVQEPENWDYYEFEDPTYWTDGQQLPNLTVLNDSGSYDAIFGWYQIIGQVRNDHGTRVEFVKPVGTLYDATNTVIGCHWTYVNATDLDPDQVSSFNMVCPGRDYSDVASYRLQVDGWPE